MSIKIGIAGWSYADWAGKVYPAGCRDKLAFCARYVDLLEVNSTFYRLPPAAMAASWAARTADLGTSFTAKLHQGFTHGGAVQRTAVEEFRDALRPLAESGRLRALLAQFSFAFTARPAAFDLLRRLVDAFADLAPLAVEVRHASFAAPEPLARLAELGVSVANLDYPIGRDGFDVPVTGVNGPGGLAYFRLHGRNAKAWFSRDAGRDATYDYAYDRAEVDGVLRRLGQIAAAARETVVVANNHFEGKAMKLASELLAAQRGGPVAVPELLVATYPELARIAHRRGQGRLFPG